MAERDVEDIYPLTPLQEGMLYHSLYSPTGGDYLRQLCFRLGEAVDLGVLEQSWSIMVNRHPALRSSVEWRGLERPLQLVHRHVTIPVQHRLWHEGDPPAATRWRDAVLAEDRQGGLDMASPPLMRLTFLTGPNGQRELLWTVHHLLGDGWCRPLILAELRTCYRALARGESPTLPERRPYRDYIAWLTRRDTSADEAWWRGALDGFETPTRLLGEGHAAENAGKQAVNSETLILSTQATERLRNMSRESRVTLSTLLIGAWGVLLSRYSGSCDVVFGLTVSGRPAELVGVELMVGAFINTVPVRVKTPPEKAIRAWLQQLQTEQVELRQHEHTSLVDVQAWSPLPPNTPLFDTLLVFGYPLDEGSLDEDGEIFELHRSVEQTNYALMVMILVASRVEITFVYDGQRFSRETVLRLRDHLERLLEGIAARPDSPLGELEMLTAEEIDRQVVAWNATEVLYPRDACVHELVALQVERSPEAVAVVGGDDRLTYRELDQQANRLAHRLRAAGANTGTVVGICVERSPDMVVGLLAILKSGAAYVPLDCRHPQDRLAFMLDESGASVLLTQGNLVASLPQMRAVTVLTDEDTEPVERSSTPPANATSPVDLAYILYTSGSTGRPKGVRVRHRNVVNLMNALAKQPGLRQEDVVLAVATYTFDMAVGDIFPTLGIGARLVLASRDDVRDPRRLGAVIDASGATLMHATPTTWRMLLDSGWAGSTRLVAVCGGDTLSEALATSLLDRCAAVWNGYGPTETTVYATFSQVTRGVAITIGRPIANVRAYILDARHQPVAIGVPGEIVIGGAGVSAGYVNRPDETAQHFVPDPFDPGSTMYRTGDLSRFLPDGSIQHMGRLDRQVKIRGNRIELGEVEAALAEYPAVADAVVLARDGGEAGEVRSLVAYVVPSVEPGPQLAELRAHLMTRVPSYMLPSAFVILDALPLTPSGKVDRLALPAHEVARLTAQTAFLAPRTSVEERVATIWARTLGAERVGVNDDFFEIGGHSLLAVRLLDEVERELGIEIPLVSFFRGDLTVAGLSAAVENAADHPASGGPMVGSHTSGASPVTFFVYPNESSMLTLRHFTRAMGPRQRLVGLLPERNGARFDRSRSIEDLAAGILRTIRKTQPAGPYHLAGFSMGGLLAYEIASRLRANQEEVAWLALLDRSPPAFSREAMRRRLSLPHRFARQRERGLRGSLRHTGEVVGREATAALVRLHLRRSRLGDDFDWRGALKLVSRYACPGNDAPMDLFLTAEGVAASGSRSLGWEEIHKGPLHIHDVPGQHVSMITEPHVSEVAEMLTLSLRRAQAARGAPS